MDDLESRLDHQLSGLGRVPLAEPEPVANLRRRARRVRVARMATGVVATATAVVLVAGVVVVARKDTGRTSLQVAAPDFVLGDIDAVVLSSSLDADGARNPLPATLAATVRAVPGVQAVSGVIDTFAPRVDEQSPDGNPTATPPRTPILFTYHEGEDVEITSGHAPEAADQIIVDAEALTRYRAKLGDRVTVGIRGASMQFTIAGTFALPGVDLAGIPLAALSAAYQPSAVLVDRLDVKFADGADAAKVRNAIGAAVGNYTVSQPSIISFPEQRLAQLEVQHAYWSLLSPNPSERSDSGVGVSTEQEKANYAKYATLAESVELRIENISFVSQDAADLTYRIYYGGNPSPIINAPQLGTAERVDGHWQLGTNTLCSLAALVGIKCEGAAANVTIDPPNGYDPISTLNPEIKRAFEALGSPGATLEARVEAVAGGTAQLATIERGRAADQQYAGKTTLNLVGWRSVAPAHVEVLYSLQTEGGPSTPYPFNGTAAQASDGHWYAGSQYACGIQGLANGACSMSPRG